MQSINPKDYKHIVFFTGAGMSAESGVPTYRGSGGIWHKYNWEEYACQKAFDRSPEKVLQFHELRRKSVLECKPHKGHQVISDLEKKHSNISIITQNIDGMHQRAGSVNVIELHGSLWRLRCSNHGVINDFGEKYETFKCKKCNEWLRPDIIWFEDMLNQQIILNATIVIQKCDLFISIGTSGIVWPAAGFPQIAKENNAKCIEINPEPSAMGHLYDDIIEEKAEKALLQFFLDL